MISHSDARQGAAAAAKVKAKKRRGNAPGFQLFHLFQGDVQECPGRAAGAQQQLSRGSVETPLESWFPWIPWNAARKIGVIPVPPSEPLALCGTLPARPPASRKQPSRPYSGSIRPYAPDLLPSGQADARILRDFRPDSAGSVELGPFSWHREANFR
jgi:hypothetical protein